MACLLCVNKSGKSINVYKENRLINKVGTIGNREIFVVTGVEGGYYIQFRGPNLKLTEGWLGNPSGEDFEMMIQYYPYGSATINGTKYKTYIMKEL